MVAVALHQEEEVEGLEVVVVLRLDVDWVGVLEAIGAVLAARTDQILVDQTALDLAVEGLEEDLGVDGKMEGLEEDLEMAQVEVEVVEVDEVAEAHPLFVVVCILHA